MIRLITYQKIKDESITQNLQADKSKFSEQGRTVYILFFFTFSFTGVQSGQSDKKPKPFIADTPPKYNYDSIQRVIDLNYYHIDATNRQTIAQLNKK